MKIVDINGQKRDCVKVDNDPSFPGYVKAEFKSKRRKNFTHAEWYPQADFLHHNPHLQTRIQPITPPPETVSTVTKAGKNSLTDTTQNWAKNIYAGYPLWISRGPGEGQKRTILKNTSHTVYLDSPWDTRPNSTSQYVISQNINNIQPAGNILAITHLQELEERARQFDLEYGRTPAPRQYTKESSTQPKNHINSGHLSKNHRPKTSSK